MLVTLFGVVSCLFGTVSIWHGVFVCVMLTKAYQTTSSNHSAKALGGNLPIDQLAKKPVKQPKSAPSFAQILAVIFTFAP